MISVIGGRSFSELGDQQLLEQTRRLAANQRCLEVHILDHLDEIDRRGLALRRGFSSLFDYAVRELRFTDAAAQRRIQTMRLCRRHGWVRASLQSGELSMTAATQLESTFAGAERAERQSRTGRRSVGQGSGGDQDQDQDSAGQTRHLGLPAAPGEAGEQGEREARSASGLAPRAEHYPGDAAALNASAVPVANHAVAQDPGAGPAGALLPPLESNGDTLPRPAPSSDPDPVATPAAAGVPDPAAVAVLAAPSSDEGPAPQLLSPTHLPASVSVPEPVSVVAPAKSRHTASRAPDSSRDDPIAELSPGTMSAAALLHPQRQRELIEQAAGMSTRQVASLLAAAAPEVVPPRDTLRAVAPDRYTLKVSIDQECEQGLRLLKNLMSHVDPRMSWGDLVARLVREAVTRHDPRGGGSGQRRRRSADRSGASPRRAPKKTAARGAADGADAGGGPPILPVVASAPEPAFVVSPAGGRSGALAGAVAGGAADGVAGGGGPPNTPVATSAPEPALAVSANGAPPGAFARAAAHPTGEPVHGRRQSPPRRHIPAAVRRRVWLRDGGRCRYRDPLSGRRCNSSYLLQIDHLLPVAQGGGEDPANLRLACFAHHRMRHGYGPAAPPEPSA